MHHAERLTASIVQTVERHATGRPVHQTPIPRLTLFRADAPTQPLPAFYHPSFCAIVQGAKDVRLGDRMLAYGGGEYLVAGFDVPVIGAVTVASAAAPYVCVQLGFDRALLLEMATNDPAGSTLAPVGIARTDADLLCALERLVRLLDRPDDARALAALYEREILYRLLRGPHGGRLRRFAHADDRTAPVERAIGHLRETFREPFRLDRLLDAAGRSQSSLYRDFREATGLTPLQYRTRLRLQEVRRLMLAERLGAAEAGYAVGYESPSQLSREYRRLYGCPPGEDVARTRAAVFEATSAAWTPSPSSRPSSAARSSDGTSKRSVAGR